MTVRTLLTGPDMIIALTIAQMALENRPMYEVITKSLDIPEEKLNRVYEAVSNFLDDKSGRS